MMETFALLFCAHVIADFLLQTGWIIDNKHQWRAFLIHIVIVAITAFIAVLPFASLAPTQAWAALGIIIITHAVIDAIKQRVLLWNEAREDVQDEAKSKVKFHAYWIDQLAHIAVLAIVASFYSGLYLDGWMPALFDMQAETLLPWVWIASMAVFATFGAGYGIGLFMTRWTSPIAESLKDAGQIIGLFERGLIFALAMAGQFTAIGFVIAGKSLLRFQSASEGKASEYVLIGTLVSISCALIAYGIALMGLGLMSAPA